jgi:cation transporter-like permease
LNEKQQYRLAMCGHKAVEAGTVCLILMVQGNIAGLTLAHFGIATKTGLLAVFPALAITFTQYARHLVSRWTSSAFFGLATFAPDALVHQSHYPGEYTEAMLTGMGAFAFALLVSFTPLGKTIDRLAEGFLE